VREMLSKIYAFFPARFACLLPHWQQAANAGSAASDVTHLISDNINFQLRT